MTGLEALKIVEKDCEDLEQVPYGEFALIEKSLKALEIIKERHIDILNLEECIEREKMGNVASALEYYNENYAFNRSCELTEEEFYLLKEVLE